MGSTYRHPSRWNDKTLVLYDHFLNEVNDCKILDDYEFTLLEYTADGNTVSKTYKGVQFIVDNGYISWSYTIPLVKDAVTYREIRFSEWLESVCKDIECIFGILKKSSALLSYGMRTHDISKCDKLWTTCCAIRTILLQIDGLHMNWEVADVMDESELNAITTFKKMTIVNCSRITTKNIDHYPYNHFKKYIIDGKRIVSKMPMHLF